MTHIPKTNIRAGHRLAIALFCLFFKFLGADGSFTTPDFAFPETVRSDARTMMQESIDKGDLITAIYAANEIAVANRITSTDSLQASIDNYRLIASHADKVDKALCDLIEARLLTDFYSSRRYIYDNRNLPDTPVDAEPALWSGRQFRNQITALLKDVLASENDLKKVSLEDISLLVTDYSDVAQCGYSVWDFAIFRVISISQQLNLEDEELQPLSLIDRLIASEINQGNESYPLLQARLKKLDYISGREARRVYGSELLEIYPAGSQFRPQVVAVLCQSDAVPADTDTEKLKRYELLEDTCNAYPDSKYADCLQSMMQVMKQPTVTFDQPSQWLPETPQTLTVVSSNMRGSHLILIPISAAQAQGGLNRLRSVVATGKIIDCGIIKSTDCPYTVTDTISVPGLKAGYYAVAVSENSQISGIYKDLKNQYPKIINVSEIGFFAVSGTSTADKSPELYVVDARTGNPIKGAKVILENTGKPKKSVTLYTDSDGMVKSPFEYGNATISYHGSQLIEYYYANGYYGGNRRDYVAQVLTDLAIYKPGDTLQAVAVIGKISKNLLSPLNDMKVTLCLYNPNGKVVESKEMLSGNMGRVTANFTLPADGITGRYRVSAEVKGGGDNTSSIGDTYIEVAEYKAPSFYVKLNRPVINQDGAENSVELTGCVTTYSGMPVADSKVTVTLNYQQPYWRIMNSGAGNIQYAGNAVTDKSGIFRLNVTPADFQALSKDNGIITAKAVATLPGGETQSSPGETVSMAPGYTLTLNIPDRIEVTKDSITLSAKVTDLIGNPAIKDIQYEISTVTGTKKNPVVEVVKSGVFNSPVLTLATTDLKSGKYRIRFILEEAYAETDDTGNRIARNDTATCDVILWRDTDVVPPVATPLWVPVNKVYAEAGKNTVEITLGNTYTPNRIFCLISNSNGKIEQKWLTPSGKNMRLKVKAPAYGEVVRVSLFGMNDLDKSEESVMIYPAEERIKPKFETITYRDKLVPGSKEQWKFRFTENGNGLSAAAVAVMSNKALNSITPFTWRFAPERYLSSSTRGNIDVYNTGSIFFYYQKPFQLNSGNCAGLNIPDWQFWGYPLSRNIYIRGTRMYKSSLSAVKSENGVDTINATGVIDEAYSDASLEETAVSVAPTMAFLTGRVADVEADAGASNGKDDNNEEITLRDTEYPLAFFSPLLSADEEGVVEVDFEVPDFNTSWVMQLLGYDTAMRSAMLTLDAVASKPLMVSGNIPAYLLTGDKCVISANVYNNTDSTADIHARIEVVNPMTGDVIAFSEETFRNVEASGARLINLDLNTPGNVASLIIRITADNEKGSDGEQTLIPIYPSSQPVMDTYTFYLTDSDNEVEVRLPAISKDAQVTMNYCANPYWYVITALSGIASPESESALVLANAIFANAMSNGIITGIPDIRQGLKEMLDNTDDATALSPLEQNRALKLTGLGNTPWVNNAESESERIASLATYLNGTDAQGVIKKLIDKLIALQSTDGGWSWMKQMPVSPYITTRILDRLGKLNASGYMPDSRELNSAAAAALKYSDAEMIKGYNRWLKTAKTPYPLSSEISYMLMRKNLTSGDKSIVNKSELSPELKKIEAELYRRLPDEWKSLTLAEKISAASLLNFKGNEGLAKEIMTSVLQFASYKENKGMWFDVSGDIYGSATGLSLVASCAQCLKEVDPQNPALPKLIQYLVLSRQTQNWSESNSAADIADMASAVVNNSQFTHTADANATPVIYIGDKMLEVPAAQTKSGNIYFNLNPEEISGKTISIHNRGGNISWGGIMVQRSEEMSHVKPMSVGALKIEKALLPVENSDGKVKTGKNSTRFHAGDRILVTLTLIADRDIDYAMIRDTRPACVRPAEQLTEYKSQDGIMMLVEPLKDATNIFITTLPKGKHIISYEVYADRDGQYSTGIAEIQSLYYPMITARSGGTRVEVTQ